MKTSNWIIAGLLFVIIILAAILIFRDRPAVVVENDEVTRLRHELVESEKRAFEWQQKAKQWQEVADSALHVSDSLAALPPKIKHHYHEIYKTIPGAAVSKLDSIIRTNW